MKTFNAPPERDIYLEVADGVLGATLVLPKAATAAVVFAHGSGSSRHSLRNRFVSQRLNSAGIATLLLDLLTQKEESIDRVTAQFRFDVMMLGERLVEVTHWLAGHPETAQLNVGYFGASTGAAAALIAAAALGTSIRAIVSRGGRPDLAGPALSRVTAPTLLIAGANDGDVIRLNEQARSQLRCLSALEIIPGASHLFEEPGALAQVASLAADWFERYC